MNYWNDVWCDALHKRLSDEEITRLTWADRYGRLLEIQVVLRALRVFIDRARKTWSETVAGSDVTILDLGCGPFTLDEDKLLRDFLSPRLVYQKFHYVGLDTSHDATKLAFRRATETGLFASVHVDEADPFRGDCAHLKLLTHEGILPAGRTFVLTRRVLQNLNPISYDRGLILCRLFEYFSGGCLIENTLEAQSFVNQLRDAARIPRPEAPKFNFPLSSFDLNTLGTKMMLAAFSGYEGNCGVSYDLFSYFVATRIMKHFQHRPGLDAAAYRVETESHGAATSRFAAGPVCIRWCD